MKVCKNSRRDLEVMDTGLYKSFMPRRKMFVAQDSKRLVAPDPYVTALKYRHVSTYGGS